MQIAFRSRVGFQRELRRLSLSPILMGSLPTLAGCAAAPKASAVPSEVNLASTEYARTPIGPRATALLETLRGYASRGQIALGHQDAASYGVGWRGDEDRSDVKDICGQHPKVFGFDLGHIERGDESNLDGVPFAEMRKNIRLQASRGAIVTLSWHMRNLASEGDAWDTKSDVDALLPGGEKHDSLRLALNRASDFLGSLRSSENEPIPILFRPYHEHNGDWFWWGRGRTSESNYIRLFRFTVDYLTRERGLSELAFVLSPSAGRSKTREDYLWGYPGDDMIDVFGLDHYHGSDASELVSAATLAVSEADTRRKVAALTEFGPIAENYDAAPNWLVDSFYTPLMGSPTARRLSYALAWRNDRPAHAFLPYAGHASASALKWLCSQPNIVLQSTE